MKISLTMTDLKSAIKDLTCLTPIESITKSLRKWQMSEGDNTYYSYGDGYTIKLTPDMELLAKLHIVGGVMFDVEVIYDNQEDAKNLAGKVKVPVHYRGGVLDFDFGSDKVNDETQTIVFEAMGDMLGKLMIYSSLGDFDYLERKLLHGEVKLDLGWIGDTFHIGDKYDVNFVVIDDECFGNLSWDEVSFVEILEDLHCED